MVFFAVLHSDSCFSFGFRDLEVVRLWEPQTDQDDENWWTSSEPEQTPPAMDGCRSESPVECCGEQIADGIAHFEAP